MTAVRRRLLFAAAAGAIMTWYAVLPLLLAGDNVLASPFHPALLGHAFNSMAEHLLRGQFDVDPAAIDFEAFEVDGRTVSYFGIFCALLRLPLAPFGLLASLDVTYVSCLLATSLGALFQVLALLTARDACPASPRRRWLFATLLAVILLGGQQTQFPRPTVYEEPLAWSNAAAMAFVWLAVRDVLTTRPATGWMAVCAGVGLLARVTFGVGMYAALVLLMSARRRVAWRAVAVLLGFAAAAAVVNFGRWGNPFVFADFTRYSMSLDAVPERLGHLAAYGNFSLDRLWLGLSYYLVPVWTIVRPDGLLLFTEAQARMMDAMELPPGSFLLSDPLLLALAGFGVRGLATRLRAQPVARQAAALLAGLAVQPLLMLMATSMAYRYRMEFYPFLVLAALLGFHHLCRRPALGRVARLGLLGAAVVSIAVSHGMAALYVVSPWGPAESYLTRDGLVGTYAPLLWHQPAQPIMKAP